MSETSPSPSVLLARGYRCFSRHIDGAGRFYQKRFDDDKGARYFLNFREWCFQDRVAFDAEVSGETDSHGIFWLTLKEDSIEKTEERALAVWQMMGGVYYDAWH